MNDISSPKIPVMMGKPKYVALHQVDPIIRLPMVASLKLFSKVFLKPVYTSHAVIRHPIVTNIAVMGICQIASVIGAFAITDIVSNGSKI
jgi:hypothetical protein